LELQGRKILLGVCGGIAAYKVVELVRLLMKNGARVQVIMTEAATKFIAPLTFETVTGRDVYVEMFPNHGEISPWHTELASWPDLAIVAPATANHMARLAAGLADDLLTTTMLTLERPKVLAPAMNTRMWANAATQDNLATLKRRGYHVVMPEEGEMARPGEDDGVGRLAEPTTIYRELRHILSAPQDLRNVRVLVTGGRTEESWDPVRVLTNRASGRMGFALAEEARERGADVMLIHGPTDVIPPTGVRVRRVTTAQEMAAAVKQEIHGAKIVLMSAAVADYTFAETIAHKIKKGDPSQEIKLVPTEDILKSLADKKGDRIIVGFALETENLLENALKKLREKHLDIVVANNPLTPGAGFSGETNQVLIIHRNGRVTDLPLQSKREIAREILNAVIAIYRNPEPEPEVEPETDSEELPHHLYDDIETEDTVPEVPIPKPAGNEKKTVAPPAKSHPSPVKVEKTVVIPAHVVSVPEIEPADEMEDLSVPALDIPFPALPPRKSGKSRRGGRRSAKARAAKRLAQAGATTATPAMETPAMTPVVVAAPVREPAAVIEPQVLTEARKDKPFRGKSSDRSRKAKSSATQQTLPTTAVESKPATVTEPAKTTDDKKTGGVRGKKTPQKSKKPKKEA
jgi:phosphopantothenoylcysteine decarboxylase/phosphopantothenate--cysteine ligase